ncbi:MAG TPA: hydroxyacylglutathione hydrolase [Solimonas sp.]|nr:hydroxyacylglutathione hydrolase [Solimonas sp.]
MIEIHAIPAFTDNYLWTLVRGNRAVVVDPGDAAPVQAFLATRNLRLEAILVTHWHPDHIGGLKTLAAGSDLPVLGPRAEAARIPGLTRLLDEGDTIEVLGESCMVLAVPGHTLGHIAFHAPAPRWLFCGDTLFSAGCGRLFEGTPAQMLASLDRLASLPGDTAVYCTHEYTQSNLAFALAVDPDNAELQAHAARVRALRAQGRPSLPTRIDRERVINPFLRAGQPVLRASAERESQSVLADPLAVFTVLRRWKDGFKAA